MSHTNPDKIRDKKKAIKRLKESITQVFFKSTAITAPQQLKSGCLKLQYHFSASKESSAASFSPTGNPSCSFRSESQSGSPGRTTVQATTLWRIFSNANSVHTTGIKFMPSPASRYRKIQASRRKLMSYRQFRYPWISICCNSSASCFKDNLQGVSR